MIEAETVDAASTIKLLQSIEALYPMLALIHVFRDNARYHQATLEREWLPSVRHSIELRSTEPLALFAQPGAGSGCISCRPIARI